MLVQLILSVSYLTFTGLALWMLKPFRNASPFFWFIASNGAMAVGTFALIDPNNSSHIIYSLLFFLAIFVFIFATVLYLSKRNVLADMKRFSSSRNIDDTYHAKMITGMMFLVCIFVTILYYNAVGYNLLASLFLGGGVEDYSTMRISAYSGASDSGSQYFAPGYVNQFKNVLLPITTVAIAVWIRQSGKKLLFFGFCAFAIPAVILAIAGTGQRGYLFYTSGALFFSFVLHSLGRQGLKLRTAILWATPVVLLFLVMTAAYYGRSDQGVVIALRDTVMRFTSIQQISGLAGFEYISGLDSQWFSDWFKALRGILPGFEGSMIAHDIHSILYGSYRGTAPLSPVGSAYYNGRIVGVVILFGALGFFYARAYHLYLRGPRTVLRSLGYGFMFFYMAMYLADSPVSLIDGGVLAVVIFLWLVQIVSAPRRVPTGRGAVRGRAPFMTARASQTDPAIRPKSARSDWS